MSNITKVEKLSQQLAARLNLGVDGRELVETLKETSFRGQVTDSQMAALLIVAEQYGLNPWTKEIYAFPDRQNGIVPVVGVDGWARIINGNPNFDGMEFEQDDESCTCKIYRKDRSHATAVTEYMSECRRENVQPWKTHPKRMLRHKSMIQCARIAFGFGGIYDEDEAERIVQAKPQEKDVTPTAVEKVTQEDIESILDAAKQAGVDAEYVCKKAQIASLEDLPLARFAGAMNHLNSLTARIAGAQEAGQ